MSLNNGSPNPARCSKRECHISSFDVTITPATNSLTAVISDPCNQVTEVKMMKAIISAAIEDYAADEGLTIPADDCWTNCCNGIADVVYTFGTLTGTYALTGVVAGGDVVYEVTPPFYQAV